MTPVVNVVPTSVPPQVPPTSAVKPTFGVTVKVVVPPCATSCDRFGVMPPFGPALGATAWVTTESTTSLPSPPAYEMRSSTPLNNAVAPSGRLAKVPATGSVPSLAMRTNVSPATGT